MLHQIRKMIGLAILMVRTKTPSSLLAHCYQATRINIPRAPALGLLLERTVYDAYNKRLSSLPSASESREEISFIKYESQMNAFKEEFVYERIMTEESQNGV